MTYQQGITEDITIDSSVLEIRIKNDKYVALQITGTG